MNDVGYGRPPKGSQFKPGVSGNPKGRPRRKPAALADAIREILNAPIQYHDTGCVKTVTRHEFSLRMLIKRAINGNVAAAGLIPYARAQALRFGDPGVERLLIDDWLPDYVGQTADQKTQELTTADDAKPQEWWKGSDRESGQG